MLMTTSAKVSMLTVALALLSACGSTEREPGARVDRVGERPIERWFDAASRGDWETACQLVSVATLDRMGGLDGCVSLFEDKASGSTDTVEGAYFERGTDSEAFPLGRITVGHSRFEVWEDGSSVGLRGLD
jgi:hypothetical protein